MFFNHHVFIVVANVSFPAASEVERFRRFAEADVIDSGATIGIFDVSTFDIRYFGLFRIVSFALVNVLAFNLVVVVVVNVVIVIVVVVVGKLLRLLFVSAKVDIFGFFHFWKAM
jgi:hypothetical protein